MQQQTELGRRLINLLIIKRIIQNRYPEALLLLKNVWNPELKQLVSINSYQLAPEDWGKLNEFRLLKRQRSITSRRFWHILIDRSRTPKFCFTNPKPVFLIAWSQCRIDYESISGSLFQVGISFILSSSSAKSSSFPLGILIFEFCLSFPQSIVLCHYYVKRTPVHLHIPGANREVKISSQVVVYSVWMPHNSAYEDIPASRQVSIQTNRFHH